MFSVDEKNPARVFFACIHGRLQRDVFTEAKAVNAVVTVLLLDSLIKSFLRVSESRYTRQKQ